MSFIRLKYIAEITAGQAPSGDAVTDSGNTPFIQGCAEFGDKHPIADKYCEVASKVAFAGDWLFSVRAPVGRLNEADQRYGIGRGLAAIRAKGVDQVYLGFLLQAYAKGLSAVSTGSTYEAVSSSDIGNIFVPCPDLPTQKRIAAFLDRETARIDELIAKKELFEKAVEADFAETVTSAVIFGLSGERQLKATGYAWQPETPEDWTVTRLKFLCSHIVDCLHETPVHEEEGEYPSIRTADVIRGGLLVEQAKRVTAEEYLHRVQRLTPEEDDVVYTREGERFGLAALVPANTPLCLGQRMMMFRVNNRVLPGYLMWSLNGGFAYHHLRQGTAGATSPHLNISDIRNVPIYLPPIEEQGVIVDHLNAKFEKKQRLCEASRKTIDRLREYRAALITAAVTGQIDVDSYGKTGTASATLDKIEEEMQA
jgi:type I restriction enzyme, S subunit